MKKMHKIIIITALALMIESIILIGLSLAGLFIARNTDVDEPKGKYLISLCIGIIGVILSIVLLWYSTHI